ncbi:hypothetical protein E2C01_039611 [Portunus trituberculatus]|uniref:Uncharacterized protein n=1 Tax=Portunus trituberculatus TaxID=210409 RepID=A0A5B7FKA5_PORTR|nr:hypothetical protein [Portunus trituberculatus]
MEVRGAARRGEARRGHQWGAGERGRSGKTEEGMKERGGAVKRPLDHRRPLPANHQVWALKGDGAPSCGKRVGLSARPLALCLQNGEVYSVLHCLKRSLICNNLYDTNKYFRSPNALLRLIIKAARALRDPKGTHDPDKIRRQVVGHAAIAHPDSPLWGEKVPPPRACGGAGADATCPTTCPACRPTRRSGRPPSHVS